MTGASLRVALAGAGMIAAHHLRAWAKLADCSVVAVADPDATAALQRAELFGIPRTYSSVASMLASEKPDAIDIAVPLQHHRAVAIEAAEHGVDILLQKPVAATLADARSLVAAITPRVRLMVHENWRFRPQYRVARSWIAEGLIGEVRSFRFDVESGGLIATHAAAPPALIRQPFLAGMKRLIVLELLIHHLDTLRALVGEIAVHGATTLRASPNVVGEDTAAVLLEAAGGACGLLFGSFAIATAGPSPVDRLLVSGSEGAITFENNHLVLVGRDGSRRDETFVPEESYQSSFDNAIAHFARCLYDGAPFESSAEDNLRSMELVEAIYAAAESPTRAPA